MHYVYILQSVNSPDQYYTGMASDLKKRLAKHNNGQSPHTAKYRPWRLVSYAAFAEETKAQEFEKYLKSGSGRAFAAKRLR